MLLTEERIWLVEYVFRAGDKYTEGVKKQFRERFPNSPVPHRDTVRALIARFRRNGSVADDERSGRPSILSEEKMEEISRVMTDTPSKSVRRLSAEVNIGKTTAHKALRQELHLFPYKVMAVHELQSFDAEKRMAYCRWFKSLIARRGDDFLHNVFFSDEAWFHLNGHVNSQNSRVWSSGNLHILHERPLHSEKIGVWVAMSSTTTN